MSDDLPLIGNPISGDPPPIAFELRVYDHIQKLDPADYDLGPEYPGFDPAYYFITSGDAVAKARQLSKDIWALAGKVRALAGKKPKGKVKQYEKACWQAAGNAKRLIGHLIAARGTAVHLETDRIQHKLLVVSKNPRARD